MELGLYIPVIKVSFISYLQYDRLEIKIYIHSNKTYVNVVHLSLDSDISIEYICIMVEVWRLMQAQKPFIYMGYS